MRPILKRLLLAAALTIAGNASAQELRMLVGTYTEGTSAEGIYLYAFDAESAQTRLLDIAPSGNPSFVIASPDGKRAYAVNEFNDGRQGVSAFTIKGETISPVNSLAIPGERVDGRDPCNILNTGEALVTSNYTGGSVSAFPLGAEGWPTQMTQSFQLENAHMHCAMLSPDGKYIFVTDLGNNCIYRIERGICGMPLGKKEVAWQGGRKLGPRHLIFSADGRFAYLLCELSDKLIVFSYADGTLSCIQQLKAYNGRGKGSADLHLSPDGRFLYTSHRLKKDGISFFQVEPVTGKIRKAGFQPTGRHPRNFALSPDGRYLLCACRDDNRIEIYRVSPADGSLERTEKTIEVGAPVCIQFLP